MIAILLDCSPFYPSFIADVINALICAIVSVMGAFWIYWISITKIRSDRLKYVTVLIKSFIGSTKRQAKYCSDYATTLRQNPSANLQLKLDANKDIKRLSDKMDQEGVYHAFLWKYKRSKESYEDFKNLYAYIDFLDFLMDDLFNTNQRVMEYMWQRKKEYQIAFTRLKDHVQRLSLDDQAKKENSNFVAFASTTLQQFLSAEIDAENLFTSYKDVVDPLKKHIVENEKPSKIVTDIYLVTDELSAIFQGILLQVKHNANDYESYSTSFNEKVVLLDKASKQLQKDFTIE